MTLDDHPEKYGDKKYPSFDHGRYMVNLKDTCQKDYLLAG